ncbi:PASTA domain-containing protein [Persephonella sp.]
MPDDIRKLDEKVSRVFDEQLEIKRKVEDIAYTFEEERSRLDFLVSQLEEKLSAIDAVLKENEMLKEKVFELEKKIKEKPKTKRPVLKLDNVFLNVSKAVENFEKGAAVKGGKHFVVSDIDMEIRGVIELDKNSLKISVPQLEEEISPDILSRIRFRIQPSIEYEEEWIELPNLIGMDVEEGKSHLKKLGLKTEIIYIETDYPSGTIVRMEPEPYTEVKPAVKIKLFVSK